jgi:large subunit ribosomal protein L24e
MPRKRICSFCGKDFPPGKGMIFVKNDGSAILFCSSKCRKNALYLRRDPRKLKWTNYYQKEEKPRF